MAEQNLYEGDYAAVLKASQQAGECGSKAQEEARLAAIDESDLYRCPICGTHAGRFGAMAERLSPLPDGTSFWVKRFQCSNCNTRWREVYTVANILIERITE